MTCNECEHLIIRKFANGGDVSVDLFCDVDHFCISSVRFPIVECNRVKRPVSSNPLLDALDGQPSYKDSIAGRSGMSKKVKHGR